MPAPSDLDRSAIRRQFDRRVVVPDPADFLLREVERRMLERLDLIRLEPSRVLDVGCGLGDGVRRLRTRWPRAEVVGLDLSPRRAARAAMLDRPPPGAWVQTLARRLTGRASTSAVGPMGRYVAGDAHQLPFPSECIDLLWSNLAFQWFDDAPAAIGEWARVLRPGALLMFSAFGVDTLRELRRIGLELPPLPDMHDIGDGLVAAGFAEPVMDTERLTVTWRDADRMVAELRALGGDARRARRRPLATRRRRDESLRQAVAQLRGDDPQGVLSVSVEVIYGHAWTPMAGKRRDGWTPIAFHAARPPGR
jgi:malonyl-CoA O-methyltransferase